MNIWLYIGIFVIVDLALLTFVVVSRSREGFTYEQKQQYLGHWRQILAMDSKEAVIEADKLLDEIMGKRGYKGTLGDKLKKAGPGFTDRNAVWAAHKLRNRLAHELGAKVTDDEAGRALKGFAMAYKDMGLKV